ncbi:RNA 2',3'-cyclic phosphodiesterase [Actinopolymorpha alba]|uniref:RNA 2',3'-cyclic phosphodiesterase n=1 Tax=Actinopolymorpha alba TaxID=533267 RepID=UPI00037F484D|nr:RNA 2',3'-cyclic phosphodiesterase [Actinopolymorpha alba]
MPTGACLAVVAVGARMRLFVAVVPPARVLDDVAEMVERLRALPGVDERFRWTLPAQWHLTLAFLGDVSEEVLPELERRLARAAEGSDPLRLLVRGGGGFGSARRARVLWTGIDGDVEPLRQLARSVGAACRRSGLDVPEGRFRAHLTLARLREPSDVRRLVEWMASYAGPAWVARRLELVQSHLGQAEGRRSQYETIRAWPFGRSGD